MQRVHLVEDGGGYEKNVYARDVFIFFFFIYVAKSKSLRSRGQR